MSGEISRRTFLRGTLAGSIVVAGFDTRLRSWVSAAELEHRATALAEDFPSFDGVLLLDEASRTAALGGKRYPFDSVPMTRHDWQKHHQPLWGSLCESETPL